MKTGGIAGACLGAGAIPGQRLLAVENGTKGRDYIKGLALRPVEIYRGRDR